MQWYWRERGSEPDRLSSIQEEAACVLLAGLAIAFLRDDAIGSEQLLTLVF